MFTLIKPQAPEVTVRIYVEIHLDILKYFFIKKNNKVK